MNRVFLRWFYVAVQFVMLAVSIPKVATLFHAYDKETMGPLIGGVDIRSWLVGIAIDLTATFTTWAAMARFDESRKRSALLAPALIILFCSALSVVSNYEDAATQNPEQYASVSLFTHPALLINPVLISAPPVLVLLLILLVPSVLARPRIKSSEEIEAETAEQEAQILARARVRTARAQANAQVRTAQLRGLVGTVTAVANKPDETVELPMRDKLEPADDNSPALAQPQAKMTRAMWQAMKLSDRVLQSGVITPQEVAEVLGISLSHARNLTKAVENGTQKVEGRSGVSYNDLIDSLYNQRNRNSYDWARRLELALGVRKRNRPTQVVTVDEITEEEVASGSRGGGD